MCQCSLYCRRFDDLYVYELKCTTNADELWQEARSLAERDGLALHAIAPCLFALNASVYSFADEQRARASSSAAA